MQKATPFRLPLHQEPHENTLFFPKYACFIESLQLIFGVDAGVIFISRASKIKGSRFLDRQPKISSTIIPKSVKSAQKVIPDGSQEGPWEEREATKVVPEGSQEAFGEEAGSRSAKRSLLTQKLIHFLVVFE